MKYADLSDEAKEKARDWYKQCFENDNTWHDYTLEDCRQMCNYLGFRGAQVMYSGFWSQGDGACFYGKFNAGWTLLDAGLSHYGGEEEKFFHRMREFIKKCPDATAEITHSGRYMHKHSVSYDISLWNDLDGTKFVGQIRDAMEKTLIEEFKELCRDVMEWMYRSLEREYDYQTSDEAVVEAITANDYDFDEEGDRA